ncbi:ABC transporter ATP-binding protein [Mycoplasmopsis maculosa]|uniref:ABC transporter ATP-binding protein n=1 Tax=Mycoplasmopsis maculosa TaxID=114885 RepID=A0A449B4U6_9BACT|nr:ABC transporter ATP-binding protein [Mycoplasmopsis maculosa]VEU75612.1 ABC transporter ATP-binding protein [Mycoplasmopsis maculosa]
MKKNINKKKNIDEYRIEDQFETVEINKETKLTPKNVFELLDKNSKNKNIVVSKKIYRLLNKINKYKRKKDDNFSLKNEEDKVIEVKNVSKYYVNDNVVTRVLKDISMDVKKGELMLIFGISGGGKSTLLNLISGLDRPSKGDVIVCDNNLPYLSDSQLTLFRRKHVSFIFQNYNLLANLNAYDNVDTGAYLQKDSSKKVNIEDLFKRFEMEEEMLKFPSQMSGGQQQRVSIMRALAKNSEIIFADEPTGALDESTTRIVLKLLYEINKETGATIVMVSHNPLMAAMADRVVHVVKGRIDKIEINKNPIHPDKLDLFDHK